MERVMVISNNNNRTQNRNRPSQDTEQRGYQPQSEPTGDPRPQNGYTPVSTGDNPANVPTPPGDE